MIRPPYLKKGNTVAIVSTARKISEEELKEGVDALKSCGLKVVFGKNLFKQLNQFAGTDSDRTADLQRALDDLQINAVWFARGGYGTVRIIDSIDWTSFKKNPKWLVGFSDITVIHSHCSKQLAIETLHAPMPFNFPKLNAEAKRRLNETLFGAPLHYELPENIFSDINRNGEATGELTGGNLSILYSLLGSASDVDTNGKILFLEDVDEYLYHVDRMMMALKRAGKLSKLAGLIVGGMTEMKDNKVRFNKTAEEIISESVADCKYPVLYGFPAGHIRNNFPLIIGRKLKMNVNIDSEISFNV